VCMSPALLSSRRHHVVGERNHLRSRMRTGRRLLPNAKVELRPDEIERAERAHNCPAVCSNYR
jgi:hypothetical protein